MLLLPVPGAMIAKPLIAVVGPSKNASSPASMASCRIDVISDVDLYTISDSFAATAGLLASDRRQSDPRPRSLHGPAAVLCVDPPLEGVASLVEGASAPAPRDLASGRAVAWSLLFCSVLTRSSDRASPMAGAMATRASSATPSSA